MLIDFTEGKGGRERERDINRLSLALAPDWGLTDPPSWVYVPTANSNCNLLVYWAMLQPKDPRWPGRFSVLRFLSVEKLCLKTISKQYEDFQHFMFISLF